MVTVLVSKTVPFIVGSLHATLPVVVTAAKEHCIIGVDCLKAHKCVLDFGAGLLNLGSNSFPQFADTVKVLSESGLLINATFPYLCIHAFFIKLAVHVLLLYKGAFVYLGKGDSERFC